VIFVVILVAILVERSPDLDKDCDEDYDKELRHTSTIEKCRPDQLSKTKETQ